MLSTTVGRLRLVGLLEGLSFLVLLGIAMPLKYLANMPQAVRVAGLAHGVLFIAFVMLVLEAIGSLRWTLKEVLWALLASLLPFGTLVLDRKLRQQAQES